MKTITIFPENHKQFAVIEALLKEMKIRFKEGKTEKPLELEDWQKKVLDKRLQDMTKDNTLDETEAHKIFDACFK